MCMSGSTNRIAFPSRSCRSMILTGSPEPSPEGWDMNIRTVACMLALLVVFCAPALAHHGAAAYDRSITLTLKATVTEFVFRNPHIIISFDAPDDAGKIVHWTAEGGSSSGLARRGWTYKTLKVGDQRSEEHTSELPSHSFIS